MKAAEAIGPVLYLLALGLFLSFFVPYVLLWVGVGVGTIFLLVPLVVAVIIYLVGMAVVPPVPYRTYMVMAAVALPLILFPNLRIQSTFWDRVAPSVGKLLMAGVAVLFLFSLLRCYRRMGALGAGITALFCTLAGYGISSLVSFGPLGWVWEPALLLTLLVSSLLVLSFAQLSPEVELE